MKKTLRSKTASTFSLTRREFVQAGAAASVGSTAFAKRLSAGSAEAAVEGGAVAGQFTANLSGASIPFNRMLFGQFLEHFQRQVYGGVFDPGSPLADGNGFRLDVIAALRELKVPIVRWPGGCFASAYHWRDGVGKDRQPSLDKAWGVEDPNTFGTDEFVAWCRLLGAEPYICTNAGTGTAEEMADWVEYCNLKDLGRYARMRKANGFPAPFHVRYWSIGNENYLGGEIGAQTVEEWGPLVRESAKMMRAVDSGLKILAAATVTGNWTPPMLKDAGKYLDYISIHGYWDALWQRGTKPAGYLQSMAHCEEPEQQILKAIDLLNQTGFGDRVKIAFDEWNLRGWHHPGFPGGGADRLDEIRERDESDRNETYTMADAVFSASFLNSCLRQAKYVHMACMAPVVNVRGPLFVHPRGVVKRTTFHVLRMYSDLLEANVVEGRLVSPLLGGDGASVHALDAVATSSDDCKRVAIALVNRHPDQPARWRLDFGPQARTGKMKLTTLSGDSPDAYNDIARPERVTPQTREIALENAPLELPPHSVSILQAAL